MPALFMRTLVGLLPGIAVDEAADAKPHAKDRTVNGSSAIDSMAADGL